MQKTHDFKFLKASINIFNKISQSWFNFLRSFEVSGVIVGKYILKIRRA